jgi:DNA-binding XRE family transcriptional regulator
MRRFQPRRALHDLHRSAHNHHMTTKQHRDNRTIGRQLRTARRAAGLTQGALASRLDISQAEVSRLENEEDRNYRIETLRRYVEALGEGSSLELKIVTEERD